MSEWRRIFFDPRRLLLLAGMTVLCALLFTASLLGTGNPERISYAMESYAYGKMLVEQWKDGELSELSALAEEEMERLNQFVYWYYDWGIESAYASEDEAYAAIADLPVLTELARSGDEDNFGYLINLYWKVCDELSDEIDYLNGYAAYLENVQTQAQNQSKTSLFGVEGSFSRRNLMKTAADFAALQGTKVTFGNNRGVEKWLEFSLGDYCHLIVIILFVLAFLEERKKGLWAIVRTCKGGRCRIGLARTGILFAASALGTFLFCVLPFMISLNICGGFNDLVRPLQSLESFKTCTLQMSIGDWFLLYFTVKLFSGVLIGLVLWCILSAITNPQFSLYVLGALLVTEYVLYEFLPVQSILNIAKYLNLFSYVHVATTYTTYLNVDLFSFPLSIRTLILVFLPVLGTLLMFLAILQQRNCRPEGKRDILGRIAVGWNCVGDHIRVRLSLGGWEVYKTLFMQYSVVLLLLVLISSQGLTYAAVRTSGSDLWYVAYLEDMEGPVSDHIDEYFISARTYAEQAVSDSSSMLNALERLEKKVNDICARARAGDYAPWLVQEETYSRFYGSSSQYIQRLNAAVAILFTAFCCGGMWAYERQSGVESVLRATRQGRKGLFCRKAAISVLLSASVWAMVYMRELYFFLAAVNSSTLTAPVQNLDALASFPLQITLGQYLALLYGLRLVMLILVGFAALLLSLYCPGGIRTAYFLAVAVLGIPALLAALGIDAVKWVSPLLPVSSAELLWSLGSGSLVCLLPWLVWLLLGVVALWFGWRKWENGG